MKKYLSLLIVSLMLIGTLAGCTNKKMPTALAKITERDKLIIGAKFDSRPFGYIEANQLKGFEIDLGKKIAKEMLGDENKAEFKQVLASNRILALSAGEVDILISTVTITDQRSKVIDFSVPYYETGLAILKQKDSTIANIDDLNNRSVIYVLGTTGEKEIKTLAPKGNYQGFRTYTDGYSALKAGRAEAMVTDKSILRGIALEDPNFTLLPQTYTKEQYGIGIKKGEMSADLKAEINRIIKKLRESGELLELMKKWGIADV